MADDRPVPACRRWRCTGCSSCSRSSRPRTTACTSGTASSRSPTSSASRTTRSRCRATCSGGPSATTCSIIALSLAIQIPFSLALAVMLNRRFRGRAVFRLLFFLPYVLSEAVTGIVFRLLLQPHAFVDTSLTRVGLGALVQDWLGDPNIVMHHDVRDHLVEVLRLPHDPDAGRPPGHPAGARGGGLDRRGRPPAGVPLRHAAAARPDDPRLGLPLDHRRAPAVRHDLGHDRRRAAQRVEHDGDLDVQGRASRAPRWATARRWP